ncbi:MAG: 2-oxo acid dehydrogenase subunit E2 [Chloracidobacterium sp.]|nr:2-oxo acid dehydrogenase subunit E2 [Chloracidobacterium sp.]
MAIEIKLPILGENVDTGVVITVLVSKGDEVTEDQPVIELETEKATVEVPASASGRVKEINVKEGETLKVGQVILTLEEGAGAAKEEERKPGPASKPEERPKEAAQAQKEEMKAAAAPSQAPRADTRARPRAEETKKEAPPPQALSGENADKVETAPRPLGDAIKPRPELRPKPVDAQKPQTREIIAAAPSVRRLARELGIEINEVSGSEPGGRVSEEDVRNYARSIIVNVTRLRPAAQPPIAAALPDFTQWGEIERKPMNGVRRKTSARVSEAWQTVPHVTHFDQADITELEELRERFGKKVEAVGGKLTITAIALKVVASALKVFTRFNASVDAQAEEIIYKKYCNIGVAVDTDRGLLVPVIRDADKKNILELAVELTELSEKARNRKIALEEMQGGSFTISNLGGIGGMNFSPIVNSPEVAILGVSRAARQPVFVDGEIEPRLMLPLALSYDHRLIDGADAARFLRWVVEALQQPLLLALEG